MPQRPPAVRSVSCGGSDGRCKSRHDRQLCRDRDRGGLRSPTARQAPPATRALGSIIYIMRIACGRAPSLPGSESKKAPQSVEKARSEIENWRARARDVRPHAAERPDRASDRRGNAAHGARRSFRERRAQGAERSGNVPMTRSPAGAAPRIPRNAARRLHVRGRGRPPRLRRGADRGPARPRRPLRLRPGESPRQYRELHRRRAGADRARRAVADQRRARRGRLLRAHGDDRGNAGRQLQSRHAAAHRNAAA